MKQIYDIYKYDNEQNISYSIHYLREYILKQTNYRLNLSLYEYNNHLYDTLELYNYIQSYCYDYTNKHPRESVYKNIVDHLCNEINFHNIYKLYTVFVQDDSFDGKTIQETKKMMVEHILKIESSIIDRHMINYYDYKSEFTNRLESCIALLI